MKLAPSKIRVVMAVAAAALLGATQLHAQTYPDRTVTIIVPFAAGGGVDTMARLLAEKMRVSLDQNVIVQNKPGASGMLGAQYVADAKPDGYTLLLGSAGETSINPFVYTTKMRYSPTEDLAPVTLVVRVPNVLVAGPSLKVDNVADMIKYAKANPDRVTYATSGVGNPQHLNGELLQSLAGVKMIHVPYKGASAQLADVAGGNVDMTFVSYTGAAPFIKEGRVKALAVTSAKRASFAKDIPALSETESLASYNLENWFGLFVPAGTPRDVVDRINQSATAALADPELAQRLRDQGGEPSPMSPEEFTAFIKQESLQYKKIVEQANITAD